MSTRARVQQFGRSYAGNLKRVARGIPLAYPPLASMTLEEDDLNLARRMLRDRGSWGSRQPIVEFEARFAEWNSSMHAYSFMSGRVALSACISALGLKEGDEVIVPGYTCIAVPNAFRFAGIEVVFADIELETFGLNVAQVERHVTPRTKAVVIQHLYGLVSRDYEATVSFCRDRGLAIIEDCAQATGAEYRGMKVGALGDVAIYSTEQSKVISTGLGGIATTDSDAIAEGLREYQHAAPEPDPDLVDRLLKTFILGYYEARHAYRAWVGPLARLRYGGTMLQSTTDEETAGRRPSHYGFRMAAPIAALGCSQLAKADRFNEIRRATAREWDAWCHQSGYIPPRVIAGSVPVFLRYPVLVEPETKSDTSGLARELGVQVGVWMLTNLHPSAQLVRGCPNADSAVRSCVNLPTLIGDARTVEVPPHGRLRERKTSSSRCSP